MTASTGKVEVGQNARTSLTMAVADELGLPVESVRLVMGDTDKFPSTWGPSAAGPPRPWSRRCAGRPPRRRALLHRAWRPSAGASIAVRWTVAGGKVAHAATGRTLGFGELTHGRKLVETIGDDAQTTPPAEWKVAGQSVPKVDGRAFVTGRHRYASDVERPGMLRGKVLRPPAFGARLASLDTSQAEAMPDVKVVRDGDFVGVVAPNEHAASRALAALRPDVDACRRARRLRPRSRELFQGASRIGPGGGGRPGLATATARRVRTVRSRTSWRRLTVKVEAVYTVAYIAHAPLEPRAAVAEWEGGNADRLDRHPAALRRPLRAGAGISPAREPGPGASFPTRAAATAASIPARPPSRRPGWQRPRASP